MVADEYECIEYDVCNALASLLEAFSNIFAGRHEGIACGGGGGGGGGGDST